MMSDEELDSEEEVQYGEDEESSDDGLQEISDEEDFDEAEDPDGEEADDDSASGEEGELDVSDATFSDTISGSQQVEPQISSRSSSPTQLRRDTFRTDISPKSYAIDPLCAFPHPSATHALASSVCMTHFLTGSEDGLIRDYDIFASANGKVLLTAQQKHHTGLADANIKGGVLRSWWENPSGAQIPEPDPVYSMALQADALWGLSSTTSGALNLFTVRHDPGRTHHVLHGHKGPVSSLSLSHDETGVFSAGWDGFALHWDLNTGQIARRFPSHGAQLTTVAIRPLGAPLPAQPSSQWPNISISGTTMNDHSSGDVTMESASDAPNTKSPEVSEDATGDTDGDYDPLFDDDSFQEDSAANASKPIENGANGGLQLHMPGTNQPSARNQAAQTGPAKKDTPLLDPVTYAAFSPDILMTAGIDGQVTLWDRRVSSGRGVGRLEGNEMSPPWCVSACWSADGAHIFAGRRNGTIDVWDVRRFGAGSGLGQPTLFKTLRNPPNSGSVMCVAAFPDKQHLVCASQDNIRLWNLASDENDIGGIKSRPSAPFKIIPGHHGGVVSQILVDATSKFMITASGNRGWFGDSSRTVIVHSITPQ